MGTVRFGILGCGNIGSTHAKNLAEGKVLDGINGVMLANAILLSEWLHSEVKIPFDDELFYEELKKN